MIHELKILPEYFDAIVKGRKTFEVRRRDRDYQVGDLLALNEWNLETYTGRSCFAQVVYILDNEDYCKEGYVILGIALRETIE
jgi:hypothetical protein